MARALAHRSKPLVLGHLPVLLQPLVLGWRLVLGRRLQLGKTGVAHPVFSSGFSRRWDGFFSSRLFPAPFISASLPRLVRTPSAVCCQGNGLPTLKT